MSVSDQIPESPALPGRYVVVFDTADAEVRERDAPDLLSAEGFSTQRYFPRLGIAVVESESARLQVFSTRCLERNRPMRYAPELTYHAITSAHPTVEDPDNSSPPFVDTAELTWGLQAVRAAESPYTGAGIRLAVLDTGFIADHPDFASRSVITESFIDGEDARDAHGHGTHCVGTACGPRQLSGHRGYGVAPESEIYSAKVLGHDGSGSDTSILAGIDWALQNECAVISMSLGADVREAHPPYVAAGRRAMEQGSLIIAAAGNNAQRSAGDPGFVGAPANSPSVMAVGAVDSRLQIADFSARSLPEPGGQIDIAAPGVDVYSSWVGEERHRSISGTSMATPHVSGVAALLAEATGYRGQELLDEILQRAQPVNEPMVDVGAGLVIAPLPDELL